MRPNIRKQRTPMRFFPTESFDNWNAINKRLRLEHYQEPKPKTPPKPLERRLLELRQRIEDAGSYAQAMGMINPRRVVA